MTSSLLILAVAIAMALAGSPCLAEIQKFEVECEYQAGKQEIRVLLPDHYDPAKQYRVLYALPAAHTIEGYGYALGILKEMDAHNKYDLIIVQMSFSEEPWYGDHATNSQAREGSYLRKFVVPFIEKKYSTLGTPEGRLLMGFSKSGWGAFSLILHDPGFYGYAAAWDAPMMLETFRYGLDKVFGTLDQMALYRPDLLVVKQKEFFQKKTRLVLTGETYWGKMFPRRAARVTPLPCTN
jgi:S-formylglutathione hydrolase FrmB